MTKAIFPGSFDPLTKGHLDIISRTSKLFDELTVVVGNNTSKRPLFSSKERKKIIENEVNDLANVNVMICNDLTVDFAQKIGATVLVRGIRNSGDLEYEKSIATLNHHLNSKVETICLLTKPEYESVSSSMIKEIFNFYGDVSPYISKRVITEMEKKRKQHGQTKI